MATKLTNISVSTNMSFTTTINGIDTNFNYNYSGNQPPYTININASKAMDNGVNVSMSRSYQKDGIFVGANSNVTAVTPFDEDYNATLRTFAMQLFANYSNPEVI